MVLVVSEKQSHTIFLALLHSDRTSENHSRSVSRALLRSCESRCWVKKPIKHPYCNFICYFSVFSMVSHHRDFVQIVSICQTLTPPKGGTSGGAEMPPFGGVSDSVVKIVLWIARFLSSSSFLFCLSHFFYVRFRHLVLTFYCNYI